MVFQLSGQVLEFRNESFEKGGQTIKYKTALVRVGERIMRVPCDSDLSSKVGKGEGQLDLTIFVKSDLKPVLRLV